MFGDKAALGKLNAATHPRIIAEVRKIIGGYAGESLVFVLAPLLFESGFDAECDVIIGITADDGICAGRIMKRDGIPREAAEKRLVSQYDSGFLAGRCDHIIENNGDIRELEERLGNIPEIKAGSSE